MIENVDVVLRIVADLTELAAAAPAPRLGHTERAMGILSAVTIVVLASLLLAVVGGILNRAQKKDWPQTLLNSGAIFIGVATFVVMMFSAAKII